MQIDDTKLMNVQDPKNKIKIKIKIKIYKKIDTHKYNIKHSLDTKLNESSVKFGCNLNVDQTPCFWSTPDVGISKLHIGKPSSKMMTIYKRPRVGQEVFPNNFPWD
jgi:hypothetical protein